MHILTDKQFERHATYSQQVSCKIVGRDKKQVHLEVTSKQEDRLIERQIYIQTEIQTDRDIFRKRDRQIEIKTNRELDRQRDTKKINDQTEKKMIFREEEHSVVLMANTKLNDA